MNSKSFVLLSVGILVGAVAVAFWTNWPAGDGGRDNDNDDGNPPIDPIALPNDLRQLRSTALQSQADGQWCAAQSRWKTFRQKLDDWQSASDSHAELATYYREESQRNLDWTKGRCDPPAEQVMEKKISPADTPPKSVSEDDLAAYYPQGRQVQSLMLLHVTGRGMDEYSLLKGEASFAYQYRVLCETRVVNSIGTQLVIRQSFPEVVQTKAISKSTLQLAFPESPALQDLWATIDVALCFNPKYLAVRIGVAGLNELDPNLKWTLTRLNKGFGWNIAASDEVELIEQVEQLSGREFEFEYVSGLGITSIKVLSGEPMDPDDLDRLAYGSSLLMDYYIFPGAQKKPGDTWTVQAEDISGLVDFGLDASASGELQLEREGDALDSQGREVAVLRVIGGEVDFLAPHDQRVQEARVRPIGTTGELGTIQFLLDERIVHRARLDWKANTLWTNDGHLLSSLTKTRDVKVQSYYEALRIDAAAKVDAADLQP